MVGVVSILGCARNDDYNFTSMHCTGIYLGMVIYVTKFSGDFFQLGDMAMRMMGVALI